MIVQTYSGSCVSLTDPQASTIVITDIACHLSRLNRFCGATLLPLNVATHSVNVARLLALWKEAPRVQLAGLLHDAHEAYMGDIVTPVRVALWSFGNTGDAVRDLADGLDRAIFTRFGVAETAAREKSLLARADAMVFAAEWRSLMRGPCPVPVDPAPFDIKAFPSAKSEEDFLKAFDRLTREAAIPLTPVPTDIF